MAKLLNFIALLAPFATRNVFRNRRRSVLTLLAVAVGISSSLVLAALGRGVAANMKADAIMQFTGHIKVTDKDYVNDPVIHHRFRDDPRRLELAQELPSSAIAPRINVPAVLLSERESIGVSLIGVDPQKESTASFVASSIVEGSFVSKEEPYGIVVGEKNLEFLQTKIGRRVVIMSESSSGEIADAGFKIIGVFDGKTEAVEKSTVLINLETAQKLLGVGNDITEVTIVFDEADIPGGSLNTVRELFPELKTSLWSDLEPLISAMLELQGAFLYFWFFIVALTVVFGLINTVFMSLFERTYEIGLVQALGMSRFGITAMVLLETVLLLLVGAVFGCVIAIIGIHLLADGIDISEFAGEGAEFVGITKVIYPKILEQDWWVVNLMVIGLGLVASYYPAFKASKTEPAKAMRDGRK